MSALRRTLASVPLRAFANRSAMTTPASFRTFSGSAPAAQAEAELKRERDEHLEQLKKYYPPSLIKSILAAEANVDPKMWAQRQRPTTEFAPPYTDDLATYDPLYDFGKHEWVDMDEPYQPIPQRIPPGVSLDKDIQSGRGGSSINISQLQELTGLSASYIKSLSVRQLISKRVVNMTRKGKIPSFYSLAIVGDRNGNVGIGEGKDATNTALALSRAHWNAVKNLTYIPRFEDRTIYGSISHKYHSVLIDLRPAPPGHGLRVNHIIYEIAKCAGIKDLTGNIYRSRNQMNVAKGVIEALSTKQTILEEVADRRGKKIVDVTNSYFNF
ncbi:hypothetical protein DV495_001220 [Geotrichum candidum]|uniref:Small ribosomal subunit protein uS5m n=1 Tax=Geotrichum candidum TaxID=1173061 RepID=A0A0J9X9Q2_GEOCN|nr:hypothetical protein DV453_000320 [Geotrichum candidum]KAI9211534.1 hypothetical protein DS838_003583 [Geotrichum bryndzae]KAF5119782.1 hypothetical protein DV452_001489 [Geotrichum candidum]KAF5132525.1 hypothetical protein DV495_001220 [Geotrichum candidum]KAF7499442.1 hypothetical protein DV113_002501 [Geotrichum candidum]